MTEKIYALLDAEGSVVNTIVADEDFIKSLPELIDDPDVETASELTPNAIRIDTLDESIGVGWKKTKTGWVGPPAPTEEELAEQEAQAASETETQAQRASDDARLQVLRAKVGPGKPGLTQAERDELTLIQLSRS